MKDGWVKGASSIAILSFISILVSLGCATMHTPAVGPATSQTEAVAGEPTATESTEEVGPVLKDMTVLETPNLEGISDAISLAEPPETPVPAVLQQRFDIKVQDAQLQDVIQTLVKGKGLNVIIPQRLEGTITLDVSSVTLEDIFDTVLRSFGYSWRIDNKFLIITRGEPIKVFRVNQAPLLDVKSQVEEILAGRGSVVTDKASRTLTLVNCDPTIVNYVERYIRAVDVKPPQVLIEIELFEVTLDSDHELGIDWTFKDLDLSNWSQMRGSAKTFLTGYMTGQVIAAGLSNNKVELLLTALAQQGDIQMISTPKIVGLDRKKSTLDLYRNIPYTDYVKVTDVNPLGVAYTEYRPTVAWREVGTHLEITPKISPDGYVSLSVKPRVETVVGYVGGQPETDRREADLYARARDGRTIVIGGLMFNNVSEVTYKVPLLGDIPYLGRAFRMTKRTTKKSEMVMFMTPHILNDTNIADFAQADRATCNSTAAKPIRYPMIPK
ncbi:MAG: hypothetical protein DRH70_00730 [Candidatus Coatesbacteria bacterium]|nr:MAG: hypothetical protein DRH70_00730 [Candidatus Coatesbacteria bacterium]